MADSIATYVAQTGGGSPGSGTVTSVGTSGSLTGGTITAAGVLSLVNDSASPGNNFFYGTNASGVKGFYNGVVSPITIQNTNSLFSTGLTGTGAGSTASSAIFLGQNAGNAATNAANSLFLSENAGRNATNASDSVFLGRLTGFGATDAFQSVFLGTQSGQSATDANRSNFIGIAAGTNAANASFSNFIGFNVGLSATGADHSNFIGRATGTSAANAYYSTFIGDNAGTNATNANSSIFIGTTSGNGATNANSSIFIGDAAGQSDTVNNSAIDSTSILIGRRTRTGGFVNSVLIGGSTGPSFISNNLDNQFMVADHMVNIRLAGLDYVFPSSQAAGALTNDGSGNLTWVASGPVGTVTSVDGADSIVASPSPITSTGTLSLVNDNATPGNYFQYGTDGTGAKGWFKGLIGRTSGNINQPAATGATLETWIGASAGTGSNTDRTVFIGINAGSGVTGAQVVAIGVGAGLNAVNAAGSVFVGQTAGSAATNAISSTFIGPSAGTGATGARNSIFIGSLAGGSDTVSNGLGDHSILIGDGTNTQGFKNSIALGTNAKSTADNQLLIGSNNATTEINQVSLVSSTSTTWHLASIASAVPRLSSTSNGTKGQIQVGNNVYFDENQFPTRLGMGIQVPTSQIEINTSSLGATQTTSSGLALVNPTAATIAVDQVSPAIRFTSQGWKSNAVAASQISDWQLYGSPQTNGAQVSGRMIWRHQVAGGGFSTMMTLFSTAGVATLVTANYTATTSVTTPTLTVNGTTNVVGAASLLRFNGDPGTSGYVLTSQGASNAPIWSPATGSPGGITGSVQFNGGGVFTGDSDFFYDFGARSFKFGFTNGGSGIISAGNVGAFAFGYSDTSGFINSGGLGSAAFGFCTDSSSAINSNSNGALSFGVATSGGTITNSGPSLAFGQVSNFAQMNQNGVGSLVHGEVDASGSSITVNGSSLHIFGRVANQAVMFGQSSSLIFGYAEGVDTGVVSTISSNNIGSLIFGVTQTGGSIINNSDSCLVFGYSIGSDGGGIASKISGNGVGSLAFGAVDKGATIETQASGSMAFGECLNGRRILATGTGSFAGGHADSASFGIEAQNLGSFAFGYSTGGDVAAIGRGSVAMGEDIVAGADNTHAFGKSFTNSNSNTFAVGYAQEMFRVDGNDNSIRFLGTPSFQITEDISGNAIMGVATLSSGTVTVSTSKVTSQSRIFLTAQNGVNPGHLFIFTRSAGSSFTINSTSATDGSQIAWMIVEPA